MINLDLKNTTISSKKLLKQQGKVNQIHEQLINKKGLGAEMTDWIDLAKNPDQKLLKDIELTVAKLRKDGIDTLLTIGIGGSFLGAHSGIDFVSGKLRSQDKVIFAGINMSATHYVQIEEKLKNRKWAICVISKSGTTLEPALSFRYFKTLLEKKYQKDASKYIIAITDEKKGALKAAADKEKYKTFVVPNGIGGRFSGITPVGLFPLAFAGVNIKELMTGATLATKDFLSSPSLKTNLAYQYATTRYLLNKKNRYVTEIFTTYNYDLETLAEWWKQLFGESEGKNGKSLMPMSVVYSRDLHSLGQTIQEGYKNFFETTLWIKNNQDDIKFVKNNDNLDGLNYLTNLSLNQINEKAFIGIVKAHTVTGNNPNIVIELENNSAKALGYLWLFFFIAVSMSAYLLGINPFNQPGVEIYKKHMFNLLENK
ncbi:MAG: glucose-6-phosphate isomerase [Mycoplasmataceae bacterium]|nr:glucose-6-phosphate isomerase [Mycoplasmataceae bacterium]